MKGIFFIVSFLIMSFFACSQPVKDRANSQITIQDSRLMANLNLIPPRFADTTAANTSIGIDSCAALIFTYDVMNIWVRKCSPKRWEQAGGVVDVGEGLTADGLTANLGGEIATPGIFSTERLINTNRKGMYWENGTIPDMVDPGGVSWDFGQEVFSPYQFISADTITSNDVDPPTANVPWSGIFARRELYYADGIIRTQKVFGHDFEMKWNFNDTISFNTQSGDYNNAFKVTNRITPRGDGRQGIRASHGTNQNLSRAYGEYALLSTTYLDNDGSNWIKVNGHLGGINSYLAMRNDTISGFVYYGTGSVTSASSLISKSYVLAPSNQTFSPRIDSAFFLFDTARVERSYHAGNLVLGPSVGSANAWSSSHVLRVQGGTSDFIGSVLLTQGADVASVAGAITLGSGGNAFEITGTDAITLISNTNWHNGSVVTLLFTSTATLTDGTANSGTDIGMELAGNTNFTASADDTITLVLGEIGGTQRWFEVGRSVN